MIYLMSLGKWLAAQNFVVTAEGQGLLIATIDRMLWGAMIA